MGNAISIKDLSKRYGKNWALSDVSFDIDEGEVCALVGENGAGKSTLIDILLGLLKATKGSISFFRRVWENRSGKSTQKYRIRPRRLWGILELNRSRKLDLTLYRVGAAEK